MTPAALRAVPATASRAVLYLRQSVARDDSISLELQEIAGRDYCTAHGYEVVAVEVDEGISGRTWSKRPAVERVMGMIERRDADVIVLWKWSRLSRSRKDWAVAADRVDVAGGRIESATEPIDTATASGRFARGVMTEYAAFQSEQIGEQWAEVRARRFNLGLPPTGSVPWGWASRKTYIEADPDRAPYVALMYDRYLSGQGFSAISAWLNTTDATTINGRDWLPVTIRKLLDSPIHAGLVEYHGETREGAHEGIISRNVWARYQRLRLDRHVPMKPRLSKHLLSSLVVCHCGRKRYGNTTTARHGDGTQLYHSYVCPSTVSHPPRTKTIATWRVDAAVTKWIHTLDVREPKPVETDRVNRELIARELTQIEKQLVKLTEHLVSGLVPEATYRATRDKLTAEGERLRSALAEAERMARVDRADFIAGLEDVIEAWDVSDVDDRQVVLRSLLESVTINVDGTVTIRPLWGDERDHVVIDM